MQSRRVAEFVVEQLARWGVKRVYGVAGDAVLPFLDALGKQTSVTYIACRHESAAAMMASAEAKLTGRPGVCLATSGPGVVNLLNGLADAHFDRVPVLAITGQVETSRLGSTYKQFVDQQELLAPVSVYSSLLADPDAAGEVLTRAFAAAVTRRDVGHLSVCRNVWDKLTAHPVLSRVPQPANVRTDELALREGGELLARAKRPLFLLGIGVRRLSDRVAELAERLGAGIILTLGAKGTIPESHPLVLGGLGEGGSKAAHKALSEADLLVILGATWFPRSFIPPQLPVLQVDVQPESQHAYEPLTAVTGPLEEVLAVWGKRFGQQSPVRGEWSERIEELHRAFWQEWEAADSPDGEGIFPQRLMRALEEAVAPDAVIALDTGEHTVWFNRAFRAARQFPLFSGKWRTMGFALPAAIAACLAEPGRQVVALAGDGGLMMSAGELMTAAELNLPITLVVVNNGTLGMEEVKMKQAGYQPFGTRLTNPDFVRLAEACGWTGIRAGRSGQLAEALRQAMAGKRPTLVEVAAAPPTLSSIRRQIFLQSHA